MAQLSMLLLVLAACFRAEPPCGESPSAASQPATAPAAPRQESIENADDLLTRLETAVTDLRNFKADVLYETFDPVVGSSEYRTGRILYDVSNDGEMQDKRFAILFDTLIAGGRRENNFSEHYVFSGGWLAEVDAQRKNFVRRRIVPPGRNFDPLKLGEGPFPLPVGQPREEVLARYDAEILAEMPKDAPDQLRRIQKDFPDAVGLALTPRPESPEAEDVDRVEVFYDRATLLPVGVNMVYKTQERKTVRLSALQRNMGFSETDQAALVITDPDPKAWHIEIREW